MKEASSGNGMSEARLRFCMELGTRLAVEQAELAMKARMRRIKSRAATNVDREQDQPA